MKAHKLTHARHIVALGGGGLSMEPDNPLLDDFILSLTGERRPKVCFVPTASGDSDNYVARFYRAFTPHVVRHRTCRSSTASFPI
jgi:peptidase E